MQRLVFPRPKICPFCARKKEDLKICQRCKQKMYKIRSLYKQCRRCGTFGSTENCPNCKNWPSYLKRNKAALPYEGVYKNLLWKLKYENKRWLAPIFVAVMQGFVENSKDFDLILPVPLYDKKKRGFNQAEIIAEEIALEVGCEYSNNNLIKIRDTKNQTSLLREARISNLKDAFSIEQAENISGKRVLLIDDVLTTGTTIYECAKVLSRNGAREVQAVTWAAGVFKEV